MAGGESRETFTQNSTRENVKTAMSRTPQTGGSGGGDRIEDSDERSATMRQHGACMCFKEALLLGNHKKIPSIRVNVSVSRGHAPLPFLHVPTSMCDVGRAAL